MCFVFSHRVSLKSPEFQLREHAYEWRFRQGFVVLVYTRLSGNGMGLLCDFTIDSLAVLSRVTLYKASNRGCCS